MIRWSHNLCKGNKRARKPTTPNLKEKFLYFSQTRDGAKYSISLLHALLWSYFSLLLWAIGRFIVFRARILYAVYPANNHSWYLFVFFKTIVSIWKTHASVWYIHVFDWYAHMSVQYTHVSAWYTHISVWYDHFSVWYSHVSACYTQVSVWYTHAFWCTHIQLSLALFWPITIFKEWMKNQYFEFFSSFFSMRREIKIVFLPISFVTC